MISSVPYTESLSINRYAADSDVNKADKEDGRDRRLEKACADFESILIYQMLQTMRRTIPGGGYLSNKSSWGDSYTTLFDQKMAEDLATRGGGLGLKEMLFRQLDKSHEATGKD